jgi:hypothetical protein
MSSRKLNAANNTANGSTMAIAAVKNSHNARSLIIRITTAPTTELAHEKAPSVLCVASWFTWRSRAANEFCATQTKPEPPLFGCFMSCPLPA